MGLFDMGGRSSQTFYHLVRALIARRASWTMSPYSRAASMMTLRFPDLDTAGFEQCRGLPVDVVDGGKE
jgi:hypothetical protein